MSALIPALRTPVADAGTGYVQTGTPVARIDGRDKVTGAARYAADYADEAQDGLLHGVIVNSSIARGRITQIDTAQALAQPGVLDVVTHLNRPKIRAFDLFYKDMTAPAGAPFRPLYDERIVCNGQPVALVVAQTFEAARHAAALVRVDYEQEAHETGLLAHPWRGAASPAG